MKGSKKTKRPVDVNLEAVAEVLLTGRIDHIKILIAAGRINFCETYEGCSGGNIWRLLACPPKELKQKRLEILRFLLSHYLDNIESLNQYAGNGLTPVHAAANSGNIEIIKLLVDYGANPTLLAKAAHRSTPLEILDRKYPKYIDEMRAIIKHYETVIKPEIEIDSVGFLRHKQAQDQILFQAIEPSDEVRVKKTANDNSLSHGIARLVNKFTSLFYKRNTKSPSNERDDQGSSKLLLKKNS